MTREILFIIFHVGNGGHLNLHGVLPFFVRPDTDSVLKHLTMVLRSLEMMNSAISTGRHPQGSVRVDIPDVLQRDVLFYSWFHEEILPELPASSIPKPGVIFALMRPPGFQGEWPAEVGESMEFLAHIARNIVETGNDHGSSRVMKFIASPSAQVEPIHPCKFDVFISYSTKDRELAHELREKIEGRSLSVFLADLSLYGGDLWSDEIRKAIRVSRSAILLLTPNSVNSNWVIAESGALWVMGTPFVPAIQYLDEKQLPSFIQERHCRDITTILGRDSCINDIVKICGR